MNDYDDMVCMTCEAHDSTEYCGRHRSEGEELEAEFLAQQKLLAQLEAEERMLSLYLDIERRPF